MPITVKEYYCPLCGNVEKHSTNHTGEIYCNCKKCGNNSLYCKEVNEHADLPFQKAVLHYYAYGFTMSEYNLNDSLPYKELTEKLSGMGYSKFEAYDSLTHAGRELLKNLDGKEIKLYNVGQFDNQIVSNIGRVFYWREFVLPNKQLKIGYWLELK